jgi:hypothetical protein
VANICIFSEYQVSTENKLDMKLERDRLDQPVFILVLVFVYFMIIIKNDKQSICIVVCLIPFSCLFRCISMLSKCFLHGDNYRIDWGSMKGNYCSIVKIIKPL